MIAYLLRALVLLIVLVVLALCLPPTRRRLFAALRNPEVRSFKRTLWLALAIYFLFSLVLTLQECSAVE